MVKYVFTSDVDYFTITDDKKTDKTIFGDINHIP
jgi:hypothetical protein